uniref:Uncharacterized protein n=1 Tax=Arcella intermedia TaxID=1963864 RepID=A0A6B2LIR5_9EUKA
MLPFEIKHNGPANINTYFICDQLQDSTFKGAPTFSSSFRGRMLRGAEEQVPPTHEGVIFEEVQGEPPKHKNFLATGAFHHFRYWLREDPPSNDDPTQKWLRWLQISKSIHDPIPAEVLQATNKLLPSPHCSVSAPIKAPEPSHTSKTSTPPKEMMTSTETPLATPREKVRPKETKVNDKKRKRSNTPAKESTSKKKAKR